MTEEDTSEEEAAEYQGASFYGECTCEHDADDHGWETCDADGCPCTAHWED